MAEPTLKPCSACGNESGRVYYDSQDSWTAQCTRTHCGLRLIGYTSAWYAARAWNDRPVEDALRARIAELEREAFISSEQLYTAVQLLDSVPGRPGTTVEILGKPVATRRADALRARIAELEAALRDSENRRVLALLERDDTLAEATARIAELKEALRFYADPANHYRMGMAPSPMQDDLGERARVALGES